MITGSSKKALWESLRDYHFGNLVPPHLTDRVAELFGGADASTKAFASKLSRKLGWTTGFAWRAIGEYKRFVYLGVISPTNVTPSKVVDQGWHEHQLFTKGYREFCRDVIDKEFDHTPELIALPEQTLLFSQQYMDTLALYRAEFNAEPPADIWAVPKFKPDLLRDKKANAGIIDTTNPPLYTLVDASTGGSGSSPGFHGFGGGSSGGAGATDDWSGHSSGDGGHGGDGGHADSGRSGGSDGGSDGGGSSCSSSCGGGSCGGGGCGGS
jgi:hypothetical protein